MSKHLFALLVIAMAIGLAAEASAQYQSPPGWQGLNEVKPNAYGLGVNQDEYGRPHSYRLDNGQRLDPIFQNGVKRDAYGLDVHMDQFGRPVHDGPGQPAE